MSTHLSSANLLLGALAPDITRFIAAHLSRVTLGAGSSVALRGDLALFPETIVAAFGVGSRVAAGMIGREGLIGWSVLLGDRSPRHHGTIALTGGTALAIPASRLADLCDQHADLHRSLLRYVGSYVSQLEHTAVSNARDGVDRRLARWLLMLHDRIDGDVLAVTHQMLGDALNVRRASVTDCLHIFEGDHLTRCTRGVITILDRIGLEAIAGESYGAAEAGYRSTISPFGKSPERLAMTA